MFRNVDYFWEVNLIILKNQNSDFHAEFSLKISTSENKLKKNLQFVNVLRSSHEKLHKNRNCLNLPTLDCKEFVTRNYVAIFKISSQNADLQFNLRSEFEIINFRSNPLAITALDSNQFQFSHLFSL